MPATPEINGMVLGMAGGLESSPTTEVVRVVRKRLEPGEWKTIRTYPPAGDRQTWLAVTQFCDLTGTVRQRAKRAASKPKAIRALDATLTEEVRVAHGGTAVTIEPGTRLRVLADEFFAEKRAEVTAGVMSPGSLRAYEGYWDRYIGPALGEMSLEWLTVRRCDQFLKKLRAGKGYPTVKGVRSVLTQIMALAVREDVVAVNPVERCADIPGGTAKRVQALDPGEVVDLWLKLTALSQGRLLDEETGEARPACHPDIPDLMWWMCSTGDRIGNALAVHWPWIDMAEARASLGPNVIRVPGEGLVLNEGTSKTQETKVGLPEQCMVMLRARRAKALNPLGPVFPDAVGGLRDPSNTSRALKAAVTAAGYGHVTSHWFRRTVGSELDRAGLPTSEVAAQLRHSDQRTTEKHYMEKRSINPRATAALEAVLTTAPKKKVVGLGGRR